MVMNISAIRKYDIKGLPLYSICTSVVLFTFLTESMNMPNDP
jgi:hypothetical protein